MFWAARNIFSCSKPLPNVRLVLLQSRNPHCRFSHSIFLFCFHWDWRRKEKAVQTSSCSDEGCTTERLCFLFIGRFQLKNNETQDNALTAHCHIQSSEWTITQSFSHSISQSFENPVIQSSIHTFRLKTFNTIIHKHINTSIHHYVMTFINKYVNTSFQPSCNQDNYR